MNIRCMIIDDEPLSVRVIEKYLANLPHLDLVASCKHAFEAMEVLRNKEVDLIFLDINLPKLSGISFYKTLKNPPIVIFITAYPEYAIEGFELEALDYLLKPFSFERFLKAINRVEAKMENKQPSMVQSYLFIKADKKLYKVDFQDILYLQAYGDYVKIFTKDKMLVTKERLANVEAELPKNHFQKIHRSYIIALSAIRFIEGNQVQVEETKLPIAATYKEELMFRVKNP
ncbi:MAG: DNA-binding LytR/AlgR family response regulator [Saprospiraceae bacterium]|jgi:DNA-binding LytR/AlgR family response regulator